MPRAERPREPPAICDNCGKACLTLDQAGLHCYRCDAGTFVHRSQWTFILCECGWREPFCPRCHGTGLRAERRKG